MKIWRTKGFDYQTYKLIISATEKGEVKNRAAKDHFYGKGQTAKVTHKTTIGHVRKSADKNSLPQFLWLTHENAHLSVNSIKSKRQAKGKLGHEAQMDVFACRKRGS